MSQRIGGWPIKTLPAGRRKVFFRRSRPFINVAVYLIATAVGVEILVSPG